MKKFLIGLVVGVLAGGVVTFLLFVGVPRASQVPGIAIKPPDAQAAPGTAQLVLKQDFFNEVLAAIFRETNGPSFPLQLTQDRGSDLRPSYALFEQNGCDGKIRLLPEGSGVRTGLKFENGRISAPLAFAGSYNSPIGCFPFTGWAQASFELRFEAGQQAVYGRINVDTVNLDGVNPLLSGLVTPLVQNSLNNRVNPILILRGDQIKIDLPIASTGGNLQAHVNDVRAEVKDDSLNLYVVYDFSGGPNPGT